MKKFLSAALVAGATGIAVGSASAATIADGGVGCESRGNLAAGLSGQCDITLAADFGQNIGNGNVATFAGEGTIFGFVADAAGTSNNFADAAAITFQQDSLVSFNLIAPDSGFDATLSFGALSPIVVSDTSVIDLGFVAAGTTLNFILNAVAPTNSPIRLESSYQLVAGPAPVPLPASALLLMAGVGAMGAMRRKAQKSA